MERLSTTITLETKLAEFNEWERTSSMIECRSMCSTLQRLNFWLVTAAAQVSGLAARQHKCLGWSSGFTLCSYVGAEHMQKKSRTRQMVRSTWQAVNRNTEGIQFGFYKLLQPFSFSIKSLEHLFDQGCQSLWQN